MFRFLPRVASAAARRFATPAGSRPLQRPAGSSPLPALQTSLSPSQVDGLKQSVLLDQFRLTPQQFRGTFINAGLAALKLEFDKPELSPEFTIALWKQLIRGNAQSKALMTYIWDKPLRYKIKFIKALDAYLSDRYPFFKGLSDGWPTDNHLPPYIRPAHERNKDFDLVNQGYLGYMNLGYSLEETKLFIWLEVLRDKQCEDRPCQVGVEIDGHMHGGCPVDIKIPEMMDLIGKGKFREALELIIADNPLPNVTGRICPQENQCQGTPEKNVCTISNDPLEIGQLEWGVSELAEIQKRENPQPLTPVSNPWETATKLPVAVVGTGPSGLINAYLLLREGYPVAIFEAFHDQGGVLRYGIPEFRLPNRLIDDVVQEIKRLGGIFTNNFVTGKTATIQDLKDAGFAHVFLGTGAGLPTLMNIPGINLKGVSSANEFLTRVNLMGSNKSEYDTPLMELKQKTIIVIGGGNTAMDAARVSKRLGATVKIVYRRSRDEMPVRKEELHHALEEGIELMSLHNPKEFIGDETSRVRAVILDVMKLGEPDETGRRRPIVTGKTIEIPIDGAINALGNAPNPIVKDSEPRIKTNQWGIIQLPKKGSQDTTLEGVKAGGDATRGGSTAVNAAGDGQKAALEVMAETLTAKDIRLAVKSAKQFVDLAQAPATIRQKQLLSQSSEITELTVYAPLIAKTAEAGQFVMVIPTEKGENIPLTLADWDVEKGTITLVVQGVGRSSRLINNMAIGESFFAVRGPLGAPSHIMAAPAGKKVVFTAGGVGIAPVYPILREHLKMGNQVTLIVGFRNEESMFWTDRIDAFQKQYPGQLEVIYTNDEVLPTDQNQINQVTILKNKRVTDPLAALLQNPNHGISEIVAIGPGIMMKSVSELTRGHNIRSVFSMNPHMIDGTGMCGGCRVPTNQKDPFFACIHGPEIAEQDGKLVDWPLFLKRQGEYEAQEAEEKEPPVIE